MSALHDRGPGEYVLLALTTCLVVGCTPKVGSGQFQCAPDDPSSCPFGWYCLPRGTAHHCYPRQPPDLCGNGEVDPGEQCDGTDIPGGCSDYGFTPGYLLCLVSCKVYCTSCGNGRVEMTEDGWGEQCDDGNLRSHDGCSSGCTLESLQWRRWTDSLAGGRTMARMVYDAARATIVLFGGADAVGLRNDTWEYDGLSWRPVQTPNAPIARAFADMVYDATNQRVVLFGGETENGRLLGDTWAFDGTDWSEIDSLDAPSARGSHAMAYDAHRGRVVLFGGVDGAGAATETWELDGEGWLQAAVSEAPPARIEHAMGYDPNSRRIVLFSGQSEAGNVGDTWTYDGTAWRQLAALTGPPGRSYGRLALDTRRSRLMLFGGFEFPTSGPETDLWEFDGSGWTEVQATTTPPPRFQAALAYDGDRERLVLFGGQAGSLFGDTWEFDGNDWTDTTRPASPPPRAGAAMAYAEAFGASVLFGGFDDSTSGFTVWGDTWLFDGTTWREVTPPVSPPTLGHPSMTYDVARRRILLFGGAYGQGGFSDETWEFDGESWTQVLLQGPTPSPRQGASMSYDARRRVVVLFGGRRGSAEYDDTWEFDGESWLQRTPEISPPPRHDASMAYDAIRQVVVLAFGGVGSGIYDDIWEYDGTSWSPRAFDAVPPGRVGAAMSAFDALGGLVLFGGFASFGRRTDTWQYDGASWRALELAVSPTPRELAVMTYDARRGTVVLFGGYPSNGETWTLSSFGSHPDERCANGTDDDGDGLVDCDDPDCNTEPHCAPVEQCGGSVDRDQDGLIGCADPSCGGSACGPRGQRCVAGSCNCPTGASELDCEDGIDNNCDGLTDCADPQCASGPHCQAGGPCQPWAPLRCGDMVQGTTVGGPGRHDYYACYPQGAYGPEAYFRLDPQATGPVTITVSSEADLELFAFDALPGGACDSPGPCIAASFGPPPRDSITLDATAGKPFFIVVDGSQYEAGPYTVLVTCP